MNLIFVWLRKTLLKVFSVSGNEFARSFSHSTNTEHVLNQALFEVLVINGAKETKPYHHELTFSRGDRYNQINKYIVMNAKM